MIPNIPQIGGRLIYFLQKWKEINSEALILQGVQAIWKSKQSKQRLESMITQQPFRGSQIETNRMESIINQELEAGVIEEIKLNQAKWINRCFLIGKPDGSFRKIVDCRKLNEELVSQHFKMENIQELQDLLTKDCYTTSIDITQAFHHVSVIGELKQYLSFQFKQKTYQYIAMPFGISLAPRTFHKILRPVIESIRCKWNVRILSYVDDIIIIGKDKQVLENKTQEISNYMRTLGWVISEKKSRITAMQEFEFLGWNFNSLNQQMKITEEKKNKLIRHISKIIQTIRQQEMVTVRELARLRGKLNFLRVVTPQASFYLMEISKVINQEINKYGWDRNRIIPKTILKELEWWRQTISINKPFNFIIPDREAVITTDASKIGWGATQILPNQRESVKESGNWNKTEMNMSSNLRETTAVYLSLKKFNNQILQNRVNGVLINTDSSTTSYNINRRRSATSLANATQMIIALAENNQYKIRAKHIPEKTNTEADSLSRLSRCGDYALKQEILDNAMKEMNKQITIDAFANRKNRKTQRFYS
ncbi:MAG: putative Transposon Ty3-G Gag-Pol polyprotein, partial [Streblomastix strix]